MRMAPSVTVKSRYVMDITTKGRRRGSENPHDPCCPSSAETSSFPMTATSSTPSSVRIRISKSLRTVLVSAAEE